MRSWGQWCWHSLASPDPILDAQESVQLTWAGEWWLRCVQGRGGARAGTRTGGAPASRPARAQRAGGQGSACRRPAPSRRGLQGAAQGLPAGTGVATWLPASSQEPRGQAAAGEPALGAGRQAPPHLHASARGAHASVPACAPGETEAQPAVTSPGPPAWKRLQPARSGPSAGRHALTSHWGVRQTAHRWADKANRRQMEGSVCRQPLHAACPPARGCWASLPAPRRAAAGEGFNCSSSRA